MRGRHGTNHASDDRRQTLDWKWFRPKGGTIIVRQSCWPGGWRRILRASRNDRVEIVSGGAGGEIIMCVFDGGAVDVRQFNNAKGFYVAMQFSSHQLGVVAARNILVGDDDNVRTAQRGSVIVRPLARTTGVTSGDDSLGHERGHILFAFRHDDHVPALDGGDDFRQAIKNAANTIKFPGPTIGCGRIWPALAKCLWLETDDLEQQHAGFVQVVVGCDETPGTVSSSRWRVAEAGQLDVFTTGVGIVQAEMFGEEINFVAAAAAGMALPSP